MYTNLIKTSYKAVAKPLFFAFDPEFIHDSIGAIGKILGSISVTRKLTALVLSYQDPALSQTVTGLYFKNPVGLSEGFDKDAKVLGILPSVGFGFGQIGSITLHPYGGNPKPRLVRLPKSEGILVNYGLKNLGVERIIPKIKKLVPYLKESKYIFGISVAKTNSQTTATDKEAIADYIGTLIKLEEAHIGDFYTLNISCPNTFGGEPFTTPERLENLLKEVDLLDIKKPVFIKMPLNIPWPDFRILLQIITTHKVAGVIIANLNKDRQSNLIKDTLAPETKGNVSGKPTKILSNMLIEKTYREFGSKLVIIGVGGIFSPEDAYEKIKKGASLVQLITGMIFEGPQLIGQINKGLVRLLREDGYSHISEAIGKDVSPINND